MAKKANKRPTRKQRDARGEFPTLHKCRYCGLVGSKYQLKEHGCNG
jgi:hypothetical protein